MMSSDSSVSTSLSERSVHGATLGRMVLEATRRHTGTAARFPRDGNVVEWSYAELGLAVRETATGLVARGLRPGDRLALLSSTRAEWTLVDCAALCAGATLVPIYETSSPEECAYVLAHSEARFLVVENAAQLEKIEEIRASCPALEHIFATEPTAGVASIASLRTPADDTALETIQRDIAADAVATIVYTSGTTGPPKGCVLTHANVLSTMEMYEGRVPASEPMVLFMFLPLAHALARAAQMMTLDVGGTLAFWGGDPKRLLEDVAEASPTHLPAVPRLFEKIHTRAIGSVEDAGGAKLRLFTWALAVGARMRAAERAGGADVVLRAQYAVADRLVLAKVRALFGRRLRLAVTGAAPISRDVLEFFDACGVLLLEGYGMTETCAAATLNTDAAFRFGTVGQPLPGTDVRVTAEGEVLLRGPNVFPGYYRDPEATRGTFTDGWLATGDLGTVDDDGFLHITGRKKDLIITSSGKNVAPGNIEAALRESRWISEAVIFGDARSYLVALVTLDPEEAAALALELELGPDLDVAALSAHPQVHARLEADVAAANERFARIEQIKRFGILDHDLTLAQGELTPTLKIKRAIIYDRYREDFERLYA